MGSTPITTRFRQRFSRRIPQHRRFRQRRSRSRPCGTCPGTNLGMYARTVSSHRRLFLARRETSELLRWCSPSFRETGLPLVSLKRSPTWSEETRAAGPIRRPTPRRRTRRPGRRGRPTLRRPETGSSPPRRPTRSPTTARSPQPSPRTRRGTARRGILARRGTARRSGRLRLRSTPSRGSRLTGSRTTPSTTCHQWSPPRRDRPTGGVRPWTM